jgi:hypothetical protein
LPPSSVQSSHGLGQRQALIAVAVLDVAVVALLVAGGDAVAACALRAVVIAPVAVGRVAVVARPPAPAAVAAGRDRGEMEHPPVQVLVVPPVSPTTVSVQVPFKPRVNAERALR